MEVKQFIYLRVIGNGIKIGRTKDLIERYNNKKKDVGYYEATSRVTDNKLCERLLKMLFLDTNGLQPVVECKSKERYYIESSSDLVRARRLFQQVVQLDQDMLEGLEQGFIVFDSVDIEAKRKALVGLEMAVAADPTLSDFLRTRIQDYKEELGRLEDQLPVRKLQQESYNKEYPLDYYVRSFLEHRTNLKSYTLTKLGDEWLEWLMKNAKGFDGFKQNVWLQEALRERFEHYVKHYLSFDKGFVADTIFDDPKYVEKTLKNNKRIWHRDTLCLDTDTDEDNEPKSKKQKIEGSSIRPYLKHAVELYVKPVDKTVDAVDAVDAVGDDVDDVDDAVNETVDAVNETFDAVNETVNSVDETVDAVDAAVEAVGDDAKPVQETVDDVDAKLDETIDDAVSKQQELYEESFTNVINADWLKEQDRYLIKLRSLCEMVNINNYPRLFSFSKHLDDLYKDICVISSSCKTCTDCFHLNHDTMKEVVGRHNSKRVRTFYRSFPSHPYMCIEIPSELYLYCYWSLKIYHHVYQCMEGNKTAVMRLKKNHSLWNEGNSSVGIYSWLDDMKPSLKLIDMCTRISYKDPHIKPLYQDDDGTFCKTYHIYCKQLRQVVAADMFREYCVYMMKE